MGTFVSTFVPYDTTDILSDYAHINLHFDDNVNIGATVNRKLIFILKYLKCDLIGAITKLENADAE